ncbi:MAG: TIGR04053 family radical SAM/SPASM domain-containing protein [Armatimonadota bacterium]|nr:TIGR04053 family radical SAM/SPASM domain-containing protein [Armatimonadota bacterium]MDR7559701.1 TIGR04053 family radical SAM/SPASM domain-containing protein [Armatimonadota bacterium]MDR7583256.1 TIGR04053 family radical SAM/SPASM domain-containing protein [Armatimonadota bacterium]
MTDALPVLAEAAPQMTFDRAPLLVYWELTRACDLACRHCRAEAIRARHPQELTTAEVEAVLDDARRFGDPLPHLVFTGGDPLQRPDLLTLVRAARARGFRVSVAPSGTTRLDASAVADLAAAGVESMSVSLDGSAAARHDAFRGVPGCFETTVRAARWIREAGLGLQVNTLVTDETAADLPAIFRLVSELGAARWSLFFLVPVGRGRLLREVSADDAERLCHWLVDLAATTRCALATTEAPHYRRVAYRRMRAAGLTDPEILRTPVGRGFGVRDGNGIVFISHTGDVFPSGFLSLPAGSVRRHSLVDLYRHADLFVRLRDPSRLLGRCGRCPFRLLCGGSRARAWARTGNPLASDPLCPYRP